jgi:hypothetical protein
MYIPSNSIYRTPSQFFKVFHPFWVGVYPCIINLCPSTIYSLLPPLFADKTNDLEMVGEVGGNLGTWAKKDEK